MHFGEKSFYIYFMSNRSRTLYAGVTGNIVKRVYEHKTGAVEGFTSRYKLDRLVYWEKFQYVTNAIAREKQVKVWKRVKKVQLVVSMNPTWDDLAADWFPELKEDPNT
jgi:putative endonuclease